jgi:sugar lactone lactonase YvrE
MSADTNILLRQPSALSVQNEDIFLVDAELRRIMRYDGTRKLLLPLYIDIQADAGTSLLAAPDKSLYVITTKNNEVLHFTAEGQQLPSLASPGNLTHPVGLAADEQNGLIAVADSTLNQIVIFDAWGSIQSIFNPATLRSIAAITIGPDGLYVLDQTARQVLVLNRSDGTLLYSINIQATGKPSSIAVNRNNLIFIGDRVNRSIDLYQGRTVLHFNASDIGSRGFASVDALAISGDKLYIADSMNARIQVLQINQTAISRQVTDWEDSVQSRMLYMGAGGKVTPTAAPHTINPGYWQ